MAADTHLERLEAVKASGTSRRLRRTGSALVFVAIGAALGIGVVWALTVTGGIESPPPRAAGHFITATAKQGSIASTLRLSVTASWDPQPASRSQSTGVLTSVNATGVVSTEGTLLYTVDLRPVVLGFGDVPAFRPLQAGATGEDVTELQNFLHRRGFYLGTADGSMGSGTVAALRAWQRSEGLTPDGVEQPGDIVWVPQASFGYELDPAMMKGITLTIGANVLNALPSAPQFILPVSQDQSALIPTGTRVEFSFGQNKWEGYASAVIQDPKTSTLSIALVPKGQPTICGTNCASVPLNGQSTAVGTVFLTEPSEGIVIPTSAITTTSDDAYVTTVSGKRMRVIVTVSSSGQSIVTGIPAGTSVRVLQESH